MSCTGNVLLWLWTAHGLVSPRTGMDMGWNGLGLGWPCAGLAMIVQP
jgi:hypothetical protein